jgi:hypothetical protein
MENSVSTNFLIELKEEYEREIQTLTNILETKREMLDKVENQLLTKCNHEWITDYIDVEIAYCTNSSTA